MTTWKVVPISDRQKKDVRPEDLLVGGDFRTCETYRGGGGYDQFPAIAEKRLGTRAHKQFIVQLYGCNLECPYCYVTPDGIWGKWKPYTTQELVDAFMDSGQEVFHLMGGAPAIYLSEWPEIIRALPEWAIFHSDLLLTERYYNYDEIDNIRGDRCLFAVGVKGTSQDDYLRNTGRKLNHNQWLRNLDRLVRQDVPFYMTFTNPDMTHMDEFRKAIERRYPDKDVLADSFVIDLIEYNALT